MKGRIKVLLLIGIIITALPILGFPRGMKNVILFIIGIGIILLAFSIKNGIKILKLKLKRIEGQQGTLIQ